MWEDTMQLHTQRWRDCTDSKSAEISTKTRDTTHRSSKASRQIPCETPHGVRDHLRCATVGALPSKSQLADRHHHTHETQCRFDKQGLPAGRKRPQYCLAGTLTSWQHRAASCGGDTRVSNIIFLKHEKVEFLEIQTYTHLHLHTHTHTHTCLLLDWWCERASDLYTHTHTQMHTHTHTWDLYTHTRTHAHTHTRTHTWDWDSNVCERWADRSLLALACLNKHDCESLLVFTGSRTFCY